MLIMQAPLSGLYTLAPSRRKVSLLALTCKAYVGVLFPLVLSMCPVQDAGR